MDFDQLKMKEYEEGRGVNQSLYNAVGNMLDKAYEGIDGYACDSCYKGFMSDSAQCRHCGSWNTRKI